MSHRIKFYLISILSIPLTGCIEPTTFVEPEITLQSSLDSVLMDQPFNITWSDDNASYCENNWSFNTSASGEETIFPNELGDNLYSITCYGEFGERSSTIIVEGYTIVEGSVAHGYVDASTICIDKNQNNICEIDEESVVTDDDGKFSVRYTSGNLISTGTVNFYNKISSESLFHENNVKTGVMAKSLTPITSLASFMDDPFLLISALDIHPFLDIADFDLDEFEDQRNLIIEKDLQLLILVHSLRNIFSEMYLDTHDFSEYFQSIAEEIEQEYTETASLVDIESSTFIAKVINNLSRKYLITIDSVAERDAARILSTAFALIESDAPDALLEYSMSELQFHIEDILYGILDAEVVFNYHEIVLTDILNNKIKSSDDTLYAINDDIITLENKRLRINVLENDIFNLSSPIRLSVGNSKIGHVSVIGNIVYYFPKSNFTGVDTFTYTISQDDVTSTAEVNISVQAVNDSNTIEVVDLDSINSLIRVPENQIEVSELFIGDGDSDDLTIMLRGEDARFFRIIGNEFLTFKNPPSYEDQSSYSITLSVDTNNDTLTKNIEVQLIDENEPPLFLSSSQFTINENQTRVGTVTVIDEDRDSSLTYSLEGKNKSSFKINNRGVISFLSQPDFEVKNTYKLTISASDGKNSATQDIVINVNDLNEKPAIPPMYHAVNIKPKSRTKASLELPRHDDDGDLLTYSILNNGTYGRATLQGSTINYETFGDMTSAQVDRVSIRAFDGKLLSRPITVSFDLKTDPLYQHQWYLNNTRQKNYSRESGYQGFDLNIDSVVSKGFTGKGVTVAVVDTDLDITHEDLIDNVVIGSYDFVESDSDPTSHGSDDPHGTAVAGIIGAKGWNNIGGRGVAPDVSLIGYNLFKNYSIENQIRAWGVNPPYGVEADIYNMSYSESSSDADNNFYELPKPLDKTLESALLHGVSHLRDGKGAIYIKAAGGDLDECGSKYICKEMVYDEKNSVPYFVVVGAINSYGEAASYSQGGAGLWVSGFGGESGYYTSPGIMTTDQSGCDNGYIGPYSKQYYGSDFNDRDGNHIENMDCNYFSDFYGMSAATATVSGVVALMLEANPDLTWRDVKYILAKTSERIDSKYDIYELVRHILNPNADGWIQNKAGFEYNHQYGFGMVNAEKAVDMALNYKSKIGEDFVNTGFIKNTKRGRPTYARDDSLTDPINVIKPEESNNFVEYVRVRVRLTHEKPESYSLRLKSPDGTMINILQHGTSISKDSVGVEFDIGVSAFYGESIEGEWTLYVKDHVIDSMNGVLNNWSIKVYGS